MDTDFAKMRRLPPHPDLDIRQFVFIRVYLCESVVEIRFSVETNGDEACRCRDMTRLLLAAAEISLQFGSR
jgi:hypothetical protein